MSNGDELWDAMYEARNEWRSRAIRAEHQVQKAEAARDRLANQLLNEVPDSYLQMKARALSAEAAIQRVWEVLERYRTSPYSEMSQTDALGAVGRALDGERDD